MAASTPYYLLIDSVVGGGKEPKHEGWIPIRAFVWGPPELGVDPNRPLNIRSLSLTAASDKSAAMLMTASARGDLLKTAKLDQVLFPSDDGTLITVWDALVSSFRMASDGFSFTLSVGRFELSPGYSVLPSPTRGVGRAS